MGYRRPLQELLSNVLHTYTAEFQRQLADAGFPDLSLALGTNVLRLTAVAELAGLSKQAISQQVAYLEAHGYVTTAVDGGEMCRPYGHRSVGMDRYRRHPGTKPNPRMN